MSEFEDKLQSILGNPDAMSQIMSIAQSLSGNFDDSQPFPQADAEATAQNTDHSPPEDLFSLLGNLDPRLIQLGMRLISEYHSGDEKKTALLTALQPFIREDRYAKVDKAIQIAKLSHIIRIALDSFRKEGSEYV